MESLDIAGLQLLYQRCRKHFDADRSSRTGPGPRVVLLQSGDPRTLEIWQQMVEVSLVEFDRIYAKLGSPLTRADVVGESAYNDQLPGIVADLAAAGLLTESGGAQCAFLPGFSGRDGSPLPVIVQKSDGGFGYSATDLAAVGTGSPTCTPTGSSTSSTSAGAALPADLRPRPGGRMVAARQLRPNTSRSGPCSARTENPSRQGMATPSGWPRCSTSAVDRAPQLLAERTPR